MIKTYSELIKLDSYIERFRYLQIKGKVSEETFGFHRYLNQVLYKSDQWRRTRNQIILRDNGCDLGMDGYDICGKILIHHINAITLKDINDRNPMIFDPENLICVSQMTHNAIHYGDESLINQGPVIRTKNDTCPWKR